MEQNFKKIIHNQGIEPRTYIVASDRSISKPTGHSVAWLQKQALISCTMLACAMRYRVQPMPKCVDIVKLFPVSLPLQVLRYRSILYNFRVI